MSKCRYSAETGTYVLDGGRPCETDDYGDPTNHCQSARCSNHVGTGELTCARCIHRVRTNLRRVVDLAALMLPQAIERGSVNSQAADLAGPIAHPVILTWRQVNAARETGALIHDGRPEHDPSLLLTWHMMWAEDWGHDLPERMSITDSAAYLGRNLGRAAQDPEQDFGLLAAELRKCRQTLESVLAVASYVERGAPCPECTSEDAGVGPRLRREHGHWCEDDECRREHHYRDDSGDTWQCPRVEAHVWAHEDYTRWVEERRKMKTA